MSVVSITAKSIGAQCVYCEEDYIGFVHLLSITLMIVIRILLKLELLERSENNSKMQQIGISAIWMERSSLAIYHKVGVLLGQMLAPQVIVLGCGFGAGWML